jgi:hypothetical protein
MGCSTQTYLSDQVRPEQVTNPRKKIWPTPAARDYKGGRKLETLKAAGRNEKNSLPDAVNVANQATGSLNPTWVEWLQGYPEGWTDLKDSETQSSPRLQK